MAGPKKSGKKPKASTGLSLYYDPRGIRIHKTEGAETAEEWANTGQPVSVDSSDVSSIQYIKETLILNVIFGDMLYSYLSTPPEVAMKMYNASSMGKFVHQVLIKDGYLFNKRKI